MNKPLKVFITYSYKDTEQRKELEKHLSPMVANQEIEIWSDGDLTPGDKWKETIKKHLRQSDILLYLVSAASLRSQACNAELIEILSKEEIRVIPIVLEHCDFGEGSDLSVWQALPIRNGHIKPIADWSPRANGWQNVVDGIRRALGSLDDASPRTPPTSLPEGVAISSTQAQQGQELPACVHSFLGRASLFVILGAHQVAIRDYSRAIELDPNNASLYNSRGFAYCAKGDFDPAIADYNRAIELDSNYALAYQNRGNVYYEKLDFDPAIADYNRAIELDSNNATSYQNRGNAYYKNDDFDRAIEDYSKVIELAPSNAIAYYKRGNAYRKKDDLNRAIEDYIKAIKLSLIYAAGYAIAHRDRPISYCKRLLQKMRP